MHSPHDDEHSMFIVNLETGKTEVVDMPDDIIFDKPMDVPGSGFNESTVEQLGNDYGKRDIERRFVPSNGYEYVSWHEIRRKNKNV